MATNQKPESTAAGTAVATTKPKSTVVDLASERTKGRFMDAYTTGKVDRLSAEQQADFLFALGARLGVKPELGELMLYQGKPYITIDGRFRLAHESGLLVGCETRPATQMERRNYGADEGDALWVCDVYRRGAGRAFKGWGHVAKGDKNPVARQFPREVAKKRAKYDALRIAFPPAEQVSALHERYIEEAEREVQRHVPRQIMSGEYEEAAEAPVATLEADEVAASTKGKAEPSDDELDQLTLEQDARGGR
jgi:hypothetical protein